MEKLIGELNSRKYISLLNYKINGYFKYQFNIMSKFSYEIRNKYPFHFCPPVNQLTSRHALLVQFLHTKLYTHNSTHTTGRTAMKGRSVRYRSP
jgi:hypothetical protein